MSLINRQQLMWAQDDRADALRRISVGEDTQKVRDLLAGSTKRIAKIEKEIAQQEAKAEADRQASQAKAEATAERNAKGKKSAGGAGRDNRPRQERAPLPEDLELPCVDCGSAFPFTGKDQVFFTKQGWSQPSRCVDCREAKKTAKPTGVTVKCTDCSTEFFFTDAKARVFEGKGWAAPKRCRDCLRVKHAKNEAASVKSGSKTSVKAGSKA